MDINRPNDAFDLQFLTGQSDVDDFYEVLSDVEWVQITPIESPAALAAVRGDAAVIEKAHEQGIKNFAIPVPASAVGESLDKRNLVQKTSHQILGSDELFSSDEAIRDIQNRTQYVNPDNGELVDFQEWASGHEIVPIRAELWVAVINHIAIQILLKDKPPEDEGESKNGIRRHEGEEGRISVPEAAVSLKDKNVTKKDHDPLRGV